MKKTFEMMTMFVILSCMSCSPPSFVTQGDNDISPPVERSSEHIRSLFIKSEQRIIHCLNTTDTLVPNGKARDFLFVNNSAGKFYLARISEPGYHRHTYPYADTIQDCLNEDNWTDSIQDKALSTLIYTRLSRNDSNSLRIDTFAIRYSRCGAGGRTKKSIMDVVNVKVIELKKAYNYRIAGGFRGTGKVTVKFAIDEFGKVIFCKVMDSTLGNPELEKEIERLIWEWEFMEILCPGNVTEVVYPFIFSI